MNFELEQTLRGLAMEAGEIEKTTLDGDILEDGTLMGADEITIVTDNTQSELEEALEKTSEQVQRLDAADASAEKIIGACDSLEALQTRLVAMSNEGLKLDGAAVEFFQHAVVASLEGRGIPAELYSAELGLLSNSFESKELDDYAAEAQDMIAGKADGEGKKSGGILARLVNVLKTIAAAVAKRFSEFTSTLTNNAAAIRKSGEALKAMGAKAKGTATGKVSSSLGGDPKSALAKANSAVSDVKSVRAAITAAGKSGSVAAIKNIELGNGATLKATAGSGENSLAGLKFSVTKGESASQEIEALSPSEISALGAELVATATAMTALIAESKATVSANEALIKAADKATDAETIKGLQSAIKASQSLIPAYVKYLGQTASAAYKVGKASAGKYKGGEAAAPKALGNDNK